MTRYVTAGELLDVLEQGAEALVLVDDRLVRGSIVAADILWLCSTPRTFEEIAHHCLQAFGPPEGIGLSEATQRSIDALLAASVLRAEP